MKASNMMGKIVEFPFLKMQHLIPWKH